MSRRGNRQRRHSGKETENRADDLSELDVYYEHWRALTPAERLRRCWAMRSRLPDPEAVHDAKLFPRP
jgi:hypothetical protein